MGEALVARYWCHMCSQMVDPVMEVEIKCPFCESGFVEEMDSRGDDEDLGSDRTFSLWAPILLGMMGSPSRRRRFRRHEEEEDEETRGESELERDIESILRRRRRSSAAILQLLQGLRAGIASESENPESEREQEREREREHVILINPFNQAVILQGSFDSNQGENESSNIHGSLGDYFIGPGLDLLLQHLAENDPNRYGTPPAQKEAVEAMPTVKITENLQCSVCLEDFDIGLEAREMPCKHKFHNGCILPWLELHSSCPVCRYQIPADGSKDSNGSDNSNRVESSGVELSTEGGSGNGRRFWAPVPWPFNGLFSPSESQTDGNSSTSASSSSAASGSSTHADEN
ncbi:E3 ubiquitin-protein ligase SIRP1-like [Magnolia sinica]|uniref:E3 ubiquitin-protein ligase SIRP1-like n=1 Tax=Magnolia sinica TaxID=86752 RepID=UPI00265941FD|nr:E3 ubiquitin-protein ligase SIRP1-like [Magnolia sinica]